MSYHEAFFPHFKQIPCSLFRRPSGLTHFQHLHPRHFSKKRPLWDRLYQVCRVIKDNKFTKHIPVLMLSGKDGFFDKVKGRLAGAAGYLTKPFEGDGLAAEVGKYLKKKDSKN